MELFSSSIDNASEVAQIPFVVTILEFAVVSSTGVWLEDQYCDS
jgi:hypothetical protein